MITSLEIARLRGIQQGKFIGLRPITVFVGPNGCGKSTVLEAAGVACAGSDARRVFEALSAREWLGLDGMDYWCDKDQGALVTAEFNTSRPPMSVRAAVSLNINRDITGDMGRVFALVVQVDGEQGSSERDRSPYPRHQGNVVLNDDGDPFRGYPGQISARFAYLGTFADRRAGEKKRLDSPRFSSALRDALTAIKLTPWYDDFVRYLRVLRPNLDSVESIAVGDRDEPFLFEKAPRKGYPVAYAGDGFRRALLLAATLAEAKGGVAALDEPEAFAHPTMVRAMMHLFERAQNDGTQILISTHSLEFVTTLLEELTGIQENIAVVGLSLTNGVVSPMTAAGADAYRRVVELRDDLRL